MRHAKLAQLETAPTSEGKIRAMTPVGAVSNRTASARSENRDPDLSGETAPTIHGGESVHLFLEFTIVRFGSGDRNRKGKKSETIDFKRHTARYVAGRIR